MPSTTMWIVAGFRIARVRRAIERRREVRKAASASVAHASQFPHPSALAARRKTADGLFGRDAAFGKEVLTVAPESGGGPGRHRCGQPPAPGLSRAGAGP